MARRTCLALFAALLLGTVATPARAASVTVAWDPNPEPNVRYVVYWGTEHLVYPSSAAAGSGTSYQITNLTPGQTYYFAVQATSAEGLVSPFSDEVVYAVPGIARAGDFTGDGHADAATFNCSTGQWSIPGLPAVTLGQCGDVPVPADYDGDHKQDIAVWRPSTGTWYVLLSSDGYNPAAMISVQWGSGAAGDVPVPGDYDGDGRADYAVYRPMAGTWWILKSSQNYAASDHVEWGLQAAGDIPVPADYDGDGRIDPAFWRPTTGAWWILRSSDGYRSYARLQWGNRVLGDVPLPADYDGDGKADPAVWRASTGTWWVLRSADGYAGYLARQWGVRAAGDVPAPRDFDGDGKADLVVWRPSTGTWWVLDSAAGYTSYMTYSGQSQAQGSVPVQPTVR